MDPNLTPDLALLARVMDMQSSDVRESFQYALVMLLVEDKKAEIIERRMIDLSEWLKLRTLNGELFDIVKPGVSEARLADILKMDGFEVPGTSYLSPGAPNFLTWISHECK